MKTHIKKLVFMLVIFTIGCNQNIKIAPEKNIKKIDPPFPTANIKYENYAVIAEKGGIIRHNTGTIINIPADAFVDIYGQPVKGKVDIAYREMHSIPEIMVSGIPMTYDSAGTEFHFESAGMNEINAYKDGNPIFINNTKAIDICMKSNTDAEKFNLYMYDTMNNQWINKGKDTPIRIDELKLTEPVEPKLASDTRNSFSINVDYSQFPELKVYENTLFQLTENTAIDPKYTNTLWQDAKIEKGKSKGIYVISFSCFESEISFEVTPVFAKEDMEKALAVYEQKFNTYKSILLAQIEKEKKLTQERKRKEQQEAKEAISNYKKEVANQKKQEKLQESYNARLSKIDEKENERMAAQQAFFDAENAIYRTFSIRQFGIYNCDSPMLLPKGASIAATFTDSTGSPLQLKNVTLVELKEKKMFSYYAYTYNNFKFNPDEDNIICSKTQDGKLAYYTTADFKNVKQSGNFTFIMRISPRKIINYEDIEAILALND